MLKKIFGGDNRWEKSKILLLLGLAGVFLILLGDFAGTFTSAPQSSSTTSSNPENKSNLSSGKSLERKLEEMLTQIAGVGEVKVKITLVSSSQRIYARNTTNNQEETVEEKDSQQVKRNSRHNKESKVVILNKGGGEKAVVKREIKPKIKGVLIVAEGAHNSQIKASLIRAVEKGLGIPSYKIAVLPKAK